jgi:hypothetical protein
VLARRGFVSAGGSTMMVACSGHKSIKDWILGIGMLYLYIS